MACSGLHCGGCGAGSAAPVVALTVFLGADWVAEHIIEVAVVSATCGVLAVAAVVALMRWADRRDARLAARGPLLITRGAPARALTATVTPQVTQATPPAITNNYYIRIDPADREAARIIRQAITGPSGDVITEGKLREMGALSKITPGQAAHNAWCAEDDWDQLDSEARGLWETAAQAAITAVRAGKAGRQVTMYKLYRDETACDSDDFGPPYGEYLTLALAMVAAGLPVSAWRTDRHCPDEIFTCKPGSIEVDWQILAPGAAAEFAALAAA